jgi:chromosomal replication initiation ATPase DnaA
MTPAIADIIAAASDITHTRTADLVGIHRHHPLVHYRQAAMAAAVAVCGKSMPVVGRAFGGRDHTTVLHAVRACDACPDRAALRDRIITRASQADVFHRDWVAYVPFRSGRVAA